MGDFSDSYGAIESHDTMEVRKRGKGSSYSLLREEEDDNELLVPTLGRQHPTAILAIPKKTFGKSFFRLPEHFLVIAHVLLVTFFGDRRSQVLFHFFVFWSCFSINHWFLAQ